MKSDGKHAGAIALFVILLISILTATAAGQSTFEVETTTVEVYRDGLAHITQTVTVDSLLPEIDLPLLTSSIENLGDS